ncbi:MAG: DUF4270 family protein [Bacteroidales bacterium]|nr:DUF4270 family protein [Bacteroidales bacterium]
MKPLIGYAVLAALCLMISATSCSDSLSEIGASTRPATDGIVINTATFDVELQTAYRDSIYVRTGYPLLGAITDPTFGEINAGYLAQFYANRETSLNSYNSADSLVFGILRTSLPKQLGYDWSDYHYNSRFDSLVGNQIDSMTIRIYYQSYYGDSLTPMQVSVYSLNPDVDFETLPESEFYSNNDFSHMYSESNLLGRKAYTAANRELSDSLRSVDNYMHYIEVRLDEKYKQQFLEMAVQAAVARDTANPHASEYVDIFANQSSLRNQWLSGVCVKPTFGDGSLIKVYYTAIYLFYSSYHRYNEDGTLLRNANDDADSTYTSTHVKYIAVTPDVIQMSGLSFVDDQKESRLADAETAYITSPQGYYSTIDLPVGQIIGTMMGDPLRQDSSYFLNAANFYLKAYKPEGDLLGSTPAPTVLMVQLDSIDTFFEEGSLPTSTTSCYATYACDSVPKSTFNDPTEGIYYYAFGNINTVFMGLAETAGWGKDKVNTVAEWEALLKQNGKLSADKNGDGVIDINDFTIRMAIIPVDVTTNSTYGTLLSVSNYILPTSVRLKKGDGAQRIQMIYTLEGVGTNSDN